MANPYSDPDDFLNKSLVDYGVGVGQESVRKSLQSTNGAAHTALAELRALSKFLTQRVKYQNQAKDGTGTDDLFTSVNATNGEVYRIGRQVAALDDKVEGLIARLDHIYAPPTQSTDGK